MNLPYLTCDLPGTGGVIRKRLEDFRVQEVPLYDPCGEGSHVYFRVLKAGISTHVAVQRIARHMHVRPTDIGFAGLKDAKAIATQMMSLEHADAEKIAGYRDSQLEVVWTGRHVNKLRMGHLAGNRFQIRIRRIGDEQLRAAQDALNVLVQRGAPNYFGPQRFGLRGDTAELGRALVRDDLQDFVELLLGRAKADDPVDCRAARDAFDAGYLDRALQQWPRHYVDQRRALSAYKRKHRPSQALAAVDKRMRRLYVSAFQSGIFNDVLKRRIQSIDQVFVGDLAKKTDTGGVFSVTDVDAEKQRVENFEISPTGPIPGYRSSLATGAPGEHELAALSASGVSQGDFRRSGTLKIKGARRPLRMRLESPVICAGQDEHGQYIELAFTLKSGCYATAVLREIMKRDD